MSIGASEVSTIPLWSPDLFGTIFILDRNFFFPISRYLNIAQKRVRCLRFPYRVLNSLQPFSFFVQKFFSSTSRFLKTEMSTVPTQRLDLFGTIFIFRSKFFFSISLILNVAKERVKCPRFPT